ncbi:hydrogenase nickel incorporation protein HypB [Thermodesulfobacterium sp. TA1]|uniref:hydrogenase nickel incorporation protein HypB n=1 Tax=Thermodesulfobacterium sp. TA1 TaxID=2234087 RepID=UPI0012329C08|nr:hydrogenase nickel incorporation protein HypB [Thermodesulfobacterium sp. TA1]QER42635.1 hydrogenase nickel incorporation protein HypB [Thermodesulfobacterium sp. TA1]
MCKECGCGLVPPSKEGVEGHHNHHEHHHKHNHGHPHEHQHGPTPSKETLQLLEDIMKYNEFQARHNREHFEEYGIYAINLMSAPGSGKTTLLEKTIEALSGRLRIGVIEGDLETERDAERIRKKGVPVYQITTGSACHLDASLVHKAMHKLPMDQVDLLFVENIGNLVCPASYDLGTHLNVTLLSVPEGEDKPEKYPLIFKVSQLVIITKVDLLPYFDFDLEKVKSQIQKINPKTQVIALSAKTGEGFDLWIKFLEETYQQYKESLK